MPCLIADTIWHARGLFTLALAGILAVGHFIFDEGIYGEVSIPVSTLVFRSHIRLQRSTAKGSNLARGKGRDREQAPSSHTRKALRTHTLAGAFRCGGTLSCAH
jgi:hypothetical protein